MRKILIITFLLLKSGSIFSQNIPSENWTNLKNLLVHRSEITLEIVTEFSKSKKTELRELQKTKENALELKSLANIKTFDKLNVDLVNEKKAELSKHLSLILVNLESDNKLKNKEEVQFLLDQLSVLEQQICITVRRYNQSCENSKSENLKFMLTCESESPEVKFE